MRIGSRGEIPLLVCIDVEPDLRTIDRADPPPWRGFVASVELFERARERLRRASAAPVHLCWFLRMDPQVQQCYRAADWVVRAHRSTIDALVRAGDEIGLHAHMYRWDDATGCWIVDHGDPAWVEHCIDTSLEAFRQSLARPCASFRFGDGWCSSQALAQLESAGVRYELTGEPESLPRPSLIPGEPSTGSLPGWAGVPRAPYRPSRADFRRPDPHRRDGIWEIPLTAGTGEESNGGACPPRGPQAPWRTLNLTLEPRIFRVVVDHVLEMSPRPYLGFMVRSSDAYEEVSGTVQENLAVIAEHPLVERFRFSTPEEALQRLDLLPSRPGVRTRLGRQLRAALGW